MRRLQILYILLLGLCFGCSNNKAKLAHTDNTTDSTLVFKYAENIKMEHTPEGIKSNAFQSLEERRNVTYLLFSGQC